MRDERELLRQSGAYGEKAAALWLEMLGWQIVERNYRSRFGEIDLIAERGGFLAFVEVKTRSKDALVSGEEAVDARKQQRLRLTAEYYLQRHATELQPRFDVIIVEKDRDDYSVTNCIENAF